MGAVSVQRHISAVFKSAQQMKQAAFGDVQRSRDFRRSYASCGACKRFEKVEGAICRLDFSDRALFHYINLFTFVNYL